MTNDELRALADALSRQRQADEHGIYCAVPRQAVDAAIKYLRACADAQPVAYKHTESGGSCVAYYDADESPCESCIPLYTHPAPAAPQAEPKREPLSDEQVLILLRSLAPDVTANLRGYTAIVRAVERHHGIGDSDAE